MNNQRKIGKHLFFIFFFNQESYEKVKGGTPDQKGMRFGQ